MLICSFYLKERHTSNDENIFKLNQPLITDSDKFYKDIFEMLSEFCNENLILTDDETMSKIFSIQKESIVTYDEHDSSYRAISFIVRSGSYGIEEDITDRHTNKIQYRKKEDDVNVKSFRCLIYVPKDKSDKEILKGIMIFQTIATYGIKTITVKKLSGYFAKQNLTFCTRSVSVRAFVEKLIEQGDLSKITFIKNKISPDKSDNIILSSGSEEVTYVKPKLTTDFLNKFLSFFDTSKSEDIYEFGEQSYNDIRVEFNLGGHKRSARLQAIEKLSVVEDIPQHIYMNGKGEDNNIINYMIETAESYKEKMIFTEIREVKHDEN